MLRKDSVDEANARLKQSLRPLSLLEVEFLCFTDSNPLGPVLVGCGSGTVHWDLVEAKNYIYIYRLIHICMCIYIKMFVHKHVCYMYIIDMGCG